jgi:hypothetical protein
MAREIDVYGASAFMKATRAGTLEIDGEPYEVTGTIAKIDTSTFKDKESGKDKQQRVIHWKEDLPALGLNKTNWGTICAFTGKDDDDDWIGERVECFVVPVEMSKTGYGIRVRKPRPGATTNGTGNGHAATVKVLGEAAAKVLVEKVGATAFGLDALRGVLSEDPKREKAAQSDPAQWPHEWGADIKAWLAAPREPKPRGTKYEPVGEDDIPF